MQLPRRRMKKDNSGPDTRPLRTHQAIRESLRKSSQESLPGKETPQHQVAIKCSRSITAKRRSNSTPPWLASAHPMHDPTADRHRLHGDRAAAPSLKIGQLYTTYWKRDTAAVIHLRSCFFFLRCA